MKPRVLKMGCNVLTELRGKHSEMMMDISVDVLSDGEEKIFQDAENESAFLLLDGEITLEWSGTQKEASRGSLFNEMPVCLHVPAGEKVSVTARSKSEVLIQKTANPARFEPVFYPKEAIKNVLLGEGNMQGCAKRILRDIFNYGNAPYSNMVLGEDVHFPGRWSSYPPHHHPQPEVYYYRFDKPQGFGVSIVGEEAAVVMDNHISAIPGGLCHPQAAAPGYAMYYVWMIRHLDGNPWISRIDAPEHTWLQDKEAVLWEGPEV